MELSKIFIFPDQEESLIELYGSCKRLDLPKPACWNHTMLDVPIKALITASDKDILPQECDYRRNKEKTKIPEPAIIFFGIPTIQIKKIINLYKIKGKWPIFSIITQSSLQMTLSCLLEHLLKDRNKELRIKRARNL